jgi:hypothetical protein
MVLSGSGWLESRKINFKKISPEDVQVEFWVSLLPFLSSDSERMEGHRDHSKISV